MIAYRRARAAVFVAAVFALLTVATSFPLATLLRQRSEVAGAVRELQNVRTHNAALQRQVSSLSQRSVIVEIAREDYGLVRQGEHAIVVLPGKNGPSGEAGSLNANKLPASDFVPSAATTYEVSSSPSGRGASFWGRVARHLEFWRGIF